MRIKCPNSDILLELPGDRTDMKFTCPACHKVHRVTITITTPGEDPPPPPPQTNRSVTRTIPQMPKKYATGAYPPVVDIPIDANFVLLDGSDSGQGIDLGRTIITPPPPPPPQPPPRMSKDLSERHTEIMRDPEPRATAESKPEPKPEPAKEDAPRRPPEAAAENAAAAEQGEAGSSPRPETRAWDKDHSEKLASAADSDETVSDDPEPEPVGTGAGAGGAASSAGFAPRPGTDRPPRRRRGLKLLLLAALVCAGYFGYQEYLYHSNLRTVDGQLAWAESAWKSGDLVAASASAREATAILAANQEIPTVRNLANKLSEKAGHQEIFAPDYAEREAKAREHLDREARFNTFVNQLDAENPSATAVQTAEAAAAALARSDEPLARTLRLTAADKTFAALTAATGQPEDGVRKAQAWLRILSPALDDGAVGKLRDDVAGYTRDQAARLLSDTRDEISAVVADATIGNASALTRYLDLKRRLETAPESMLRAQPDLKRRLPDLATLHNQETMVQLDRLATLLATARSSARSVLAREAPVDSMIDELAAKARTDTKPNADLATAASKLIQDALSDSDELIRLRSDLFGQLQMEMRRGRSNPGTYLAWSMLRSGFGDPEIEIDPAGFKYDSDSAAMQFSLDGLPGAMKMRADDMDTAVRANLGGYDFATGWTLLFHKPMTWMASLARDMQAAGVNPEQHPAWEALEGPGMLVALSAGRPVGSDSGLAAPADAGPRALFYDGELHQVVELPQREDAQRLAENFRYIAERLHDTVMADESVSQSLRQALKPVLMGTYQKPDPRDYFDSAFCRRLIEADYLETYIAPMPPAIAGDLASFREALGKIDAGRDEFVIELGDGKRLVAVARMDPDLASDGKQADQNPETGESEPRYTWRLESADETVFFSPLPSRMVYAFTMAEYYDGRHNIRPKGVPAKTEVWHATHGFMASRQQGEVAATGDPLLWAQAIADDLSGRADPSMGPPGWNFPLHVLERDDQGDPVSLATLSGVVESPDFGGYEDEDERRQAEEEWLDSTAATLATPGELGLIFHQFFRYCSDSPLPELPNLIGSHYGLSDTHQTVYESLERRWVGRLIGDCDDLAEFFQVLTRRQGKLSHVMQLPGHAAAGYVERTEDDEYRFVVLQTGPVLQYVAPTLNDVVEFAYRSFDREGGLSHMTTDAVPLLLRFANEETRTPFVLSARIYEDAQYAEDMIRIQAYWHEHVYSAALREMEEMVKNDQDVGNIKELGSLYERVGMYAKSAEVRQREYAMVKSDPVASLSTLLTIVQLHFQDKDKAKALNALEMMEDVMLDMVRREDAGEFFRAISFRSFWAMYLSRLDQPARAWNLVRQDAMATKRQLGRIADPVLRTMVVIYDRLGVKKQKNPVLATEDEKAMEELRRETEEAFGRGYFKADDSYNAIIGRYFTLGRYAVADAGRADGLARLRQDGPYPTKTKDHVARGRRLSDEDWEWFRITPQLYLAYGMDMLDQDEYPEFYDPAGAKSLLEDVARAVAKGAGLGSDVAGGDDAIKAALALSFINRDLASFRTTMTEVLRKDYASLYDDAAMTFGLNCGLIPTREFGAWIDAFHEFFPGSQHYFKVAYRAMDKEHYDHALMMAEATARFFPEEKLLVQEAEFMRRRIPELKAWKAARAR